MKAYEKVQSRKGGRMAIPTRWRERLKGGKQYKHSNTFTYSNGLRESVEIVLDSWTSVPASIGAGMPPECANSDH